MAVLFAACRVNIFGWPVIGLWGDPLYDCSDIDSCCSDHSGKLIVMGDDYGRIKLFRSVLSVFARSDHCGRGGCLCLFDFFEGSPPPTSPPIAVCTVSPPHRPHLALSLSLCVCAGGHSAHVTRVLFTKDNKVFSTGGRDATLLQWRAVELKPPPLPQ